MTVRKLDFNLKKAEIAFETPIVPKGQGVYTIVSAHRELVLN